MVPQTVSGFAPAGEVSSRRSNSNSNSNMSQTSIPDVILLFHLVVTMLMLYAICSSMLASTTSSYSEEVCGTLLTFGIPIGLLSYHGLQKGGGTATTTSRPSRDSPTSRLCGWLIVASPIFNIICLAAVYVASSASDALAQHVSGIPLADMMILVALQCITSTRLRHFSKAPKNEQGGSARLPQEVFGKVVTHCPVNAAAAPSCPSSPRSPAPSPAPAASGQGRGSAAAAEASEARQQSPPAGGEPSASNRRNQKVRNPVRHLPHGQTVYSGTIVSYLPDREIGFITADSSADFVADLYFKVTTMTKEVQDLGKYMVGVHVNFVVRYRADGTPQIRAAMPSSPDEVYAQFGGAHLHAAASGGKW